MIERIPVFLLTGFLGSGKTTLLARWLKEAPLREAALIVNEIGAVALDHATLGFAADASALLADACICCSGLPGLHEALENLFWARLHRSVKRFDSVVIETTGLANPGPLVASMQSQPFINERYRLAGVVTTIGAPTALQTIDAFSEARAQLDAADLIVLTKTDLADDAARQPIIDVLHRLHPLTRVLLSAHADLGGAHVLRHLEEARGASQQRPEQVWQPPANPRIGAGFSRRGGNSRHAAQTRFEAIEGVRNFDALNARLDALIDTHRDALLRMKGIVRMRDGTSLTVQFVRGDRHASLTNAPVDRSEPEVPGGVTLILRTTQAP
ncbi:GTP-binding protein [Paraburkholderia panacisoli]|uniref:GTP-binding protein n=1 Tax=Paraburkholderia panacisoli TaxID=2603818 RepID=A0A5B0HH89_9BURK|nr:GTP-binding protein [Paraburkholderia panacisoli]KAA1014487.1 GTP-binding protein [Paraburkholderia panacisoli]